MSAQHRTQSERDQPQLLRVRPGNLAPAITPRHALIGVFRKQQCGRSADLLRVSLARQSADYET